MELLFLYTINILVSISINDQCFVRSNIFVASFPGFDPRNLTCFDKGLKKGQNTDIRSSEAEVLWTQHLDGETDSTLEIHHDCYIHLNMEVGLLHTDEQGNRFT